MANDSKRTDNPAGRSDVSSVAPEASPPAQRLAKRMLGPLERFLHVEAASGVVLLVAAVIGLGWANSPWVAAYEALWHTTITFGFAGWVFQESLHFWINDGLMAIFFFVVGLEVRREIHEGELSELRKAALPIVAAVGGMLAPASMYLLVSSGGGDAQRGFGVPTATDIAFAVGVLALLGKRVLPALRVLLLALAIIDDIGAILMIALFYSSGIAISGLLVAAAGIAIVLALQRIGVRTPFVYLLPALVVWSGVLAAGVHPTIAGVVLGLLTPVRGSLRLQTQLHGFVAFGIMPVFALANAGVSLSSEGLSGEGAPGVLFGVLVGLVAGKPLGILLASVAAVKLGLCKLPAGVSFAGVGVVGLVAGIGFTMAIFIADLAFVRSPELLAAAKLGVLLASVLAAVGGLIAGRLLLAPQPAAGAARTLAEAEALAER